MCRLEGDALKTSSAALMLALLILALCHLMRHASLFKSLLSKVFFCVHEKTRSPGKIYDMFMTANLSLKNLKSLTLDLPFLQAATFILRLANGESSRPLRGGRSTPLRHFLTLERPVNIHLYSFADQTP